jgi:hypothetical protein
VRQRIFASVAILLTTAFSTSSLADHRPPSDLKSAIRSADRVVVGTVVAVQPYWHENKWGDRLIVSRTWVRPTETLKGKPSAKDVPIAIEGGTLDGLTLVVSDLPAVSRGERGVFLLKREADGQFVPSGRSEGVLKLTPNNTVAGSNLRLEDVRRAAAAAR